MLASSLYTLTPHYPATFPCMHRLHSSNTPHRLFYSAVSELFLDTASTMSTSPNPDGVEQAVHEYSRTESRLKEKSTVTFDEKTADTEYAVELQDGGKRNRPREYIRSFRSIFKVQHAREAAAVMVKFGKFVGPGTIITVAYIDPDNFQTAVSSGAQFKYKLLFMVLVSNVIAIYLQVRWTMANVRKKCH